MNKSTEDKSRDERFLNALVEELQAMSDTDVLQGENPEELVRLGDRLLIKAREEAGKRRMSDARNRLAILSQSRPPTTEVSVARAKEYLQSHPELTLAARNLDELSDADLLRLFRDAIHLEELQDPLRRGADEK